MSEAETSKPKSGGLAKFLLISVMVLAVLVLGALGALYGGYKWLEAQFAAPGPTVEDTVVMLPRGSGLIRIAAQLENEGVITDQRIFRAAVTLDQGDRSLRAGEYSIPAGASMAQVYELLRSGQTIQHSVTFAEGLTSAMIVAVLNESDVLTGEITEVPAEGTLLPETYHVTRGTSRQDLLDRMARDQRGCTCTRAASPFCTRRAESSSSFAAQPHFDWRTRSQRGQPMVATPVRATTAARPRTQAAPCPRGAALARPTAATKR